MFLFFHKPKILADLEEESTHVPLKIEGTIPEWLFGTYVRNGPINVSIDNQSSPHWFDGLAMLHAFNFDNQQIFYSNRFLRTPAYTQVFKKNSLKIRGFATYVPISLYNKIAKWLHLTLPVAWPNANQNLTRIANHYVALTESVVPVAFDLQSLNTVDLLDFKDHLAPNAQWGCSHPHHDLYLKEQINYLIEPGPPANYLIYRIKDGTTQRELIAKISTSQISYMHSFALTKHYIILTEFPLIVEENLDNKAAFIDRCVWRPEKGTWFSIIDRQTGQLICRCETVSFFAFHHVNAYETKDKIHLDLICYDNASIIQKLSKHANTTAELENTAPSRLVRFTIDLATYQVKTNVLFKKFCEYPRINDSFDGRSYLFVYLVDARNTLFINEIRSLYKVNVQTKEFKSWSQEGCYPGEPLFVESPFSNGEDEGVVLSIVTYAQKYSSFLLILDAKSFKEIARAKISSIIPMGLHGQFFR